MKKRVLLFGPLGDFGGREVEANIIAKSLQDSYDLSFFSTKYYTKHSYAFLGIKEIAHSSFQKRIYQSFFFIKVLANLVRLKNGNKKLAYAYTQNAVSKKYFNFKKVKAEILRQEIEKVDVVIACVQFSSGYLEEAITIAKQLQKPFFIRTTGTIREFDVKAYQFLKQCSCVFYHSQANAETANKQLELPYVILDQCAQNEAKLLALPIRDNQRVFGYLGRLSPEKGILELIDFFKASKGCKLLIAGDGPLLSEVLDAIQNEDSIEYLGQCPPDNLDTFFAKINTLVIPSHEEAGPLVGLEAMAAGKVILSTKVGAMQERLAGTTNDFWFDSNDKSSFLSSLEQINKLQSEAFVNIAQGNRDKYLAEYQFAAIQKKYSTCLDNYIK